MSQHHPQSSHPKYNMRKSILRNPSPAEAKLIYFLL